MHKCFFTIFYSLAIYFTVSGNLFAAGLTVDDSYCNTEEKAFQEIDSILRQYSKLLTPENADVPFSEYCEDYGVDFEMLGEEFSTDFAEFRGSSISSDAPELQDISQDTYRILKSEILRVVSIYKEQCAKELKASVEKKIPFETSLMESQLGGTVQMVYEPLRGLNKLWFWTSDSESKRSALIIYPVKDKNGVYDLNPSNQKQKNTLKLFKELSRVYKMTFHRVHSIQQIKELIVKIRPEYLILGGHGTAKSICFDEGVYLRVNSDLSFLNDIPLKHIYLDSCSVGGDTSDDCNMVQIFARTVPYCKVTGPTIPHMDEYVAGLNQDMSVKLEKDKKSVVFEFEK